MLSLSPPLAGSTTTVAVVLVVFTSTTLVPVRMSMPCRFRMRANCLDTSVSMPGVMRSMNSTTVTLAPNRRHTEPISSPI